MRVLSCVLAIAMLARADIARGQEERKVVLMLSEYRPDSQFTVDREEIIRTTLSRAFERGVDYYAEFIDIASFPSAQYSLELREFLQRKYEHTRFDAVITLGPVALEFARTNDTSLFNGAPVVASTVDREAIQETDGGPPVTGVARELDPQGTIDFMLSLQPDITRLCVIAGGRARTLRDLTELQLGSVERRFAIDYLFDLPMDEVLERVRTLPARTAILYVGVTEDGSGKRFQTDEALKLVLEAAKAPVYGMFANQLEFGLVGGRLIDTDIMAREVAELTVEQLRHGSAEAVPIRESRSTVPMANWRELRRWKLSEARLPAGTVVRNREPTAWERYRAYIVGALSLITLQMMMIAALLMQRTRRRRAEELIRTKERALRVSLERIQDLAGRLIAAEEAERARIARDLHDGVSQEVAVIAIGVGSLRELLGSGGVELHVELDELQQRATALGDWIRDLSHDLHPALLQHAGLVGALRHHCREFARQHGIETTFVAGDDIGRIEGDAELCLYRVAQEALRNVSRHAGAPHARVALERTATMFELTIADDGRGFDAGHQRGNGSGLGLLSIDERVRSIKGTMKLESQPGLGTTVRVQVPLRPLEFPAARVPPADAQATLNEGPAPIRIGTPAFDSKATTKS